VTLNIYIFLAGDYHSGYPITLQGGQTEASAFLNISNLEQNGAWQITSMLGANHNWMSGFYHNGYGNTIGNLWSIYVNQRVDFSDFFLVLALSLAKKQKNKHL
jgi:hypothetical protein